MKVSHFKRRDLVEVGKVLNTDFTVNSAESSIASILSQIFFNQPNHFFC